MVFLDHAPEPLAHSMEMENGAVRKDWEDIDQFRDLTMVPEAVPAQEVMAGVPDYWAKSLERGLAELDECQV